MQYTWYITHLLMGAIDSINLGGAIMLAIRSVKIRKVLKRTLIPNIIFLVIYVLLQYNWYLITIFYTPLIAVQFIINYYILLKSRDTFKELFTFNQIIDVTFIADIVTDIVFCNITLITSTILYVIFRSIGVLVPVCQLLYTIVYSTVVGYTLCSNLLIEQKLTFDQRLDFIERHLVYIVGYGLPLTIGYNTLSLIVYFAIQSIVMPLMIINSKLHFNPQEVPGGPLKLITFLNNINTKIFFGILFVVHTRISNEKIQVATKQDN